MAEGKGNTDKSTKVIIFETAVELFYHKGYNFVSIREIANEVGIKGSSIYNHYKSKEDILDAIFEYFTLVSNSSSKNFARDEEVERLIEANKLEELLGLQVHMSTGFLGNELVKRIFRIISVEQYHNEKVRSFFYDNFVLNPREALERLFARLIEKGRVKGFEPKLLAAEFHSYIIYKYYENVILKGDIDFEPERLMEEFRTHIEFFCRLIKA